MPRIPFIGNLGKGGKVQADPPSSGSAPTQPLEQLVGHTTQAEDPGTVKPRIGGPPLGQSGRANFYGLPQPDETNPQLVGPTGIRLLDEMYRSDPHVRRLVLAAWSPVVAGTWALEPYGGENAKESDRKIAETVWWMLTEWMRPNFYQHLHELGPVLLRSGFTPFEQIWGSVKRDGKTLLGPRKLDIRLPRTIWRWWQDDYGDLTHIGQILPNRPDVVIPTTDLIYYRLGAEGDNWQGTALLRHCFKPWMIKDRLERIDAIGQERKAVGVPIVYHSEQIDPKTLNQVEQAVANMHVSEVAYLMLPGRKMGTAGAGQMSAGEREWLVDVVQFDSSSGGGIRQSIEYYQQAISASFLTDFLELGHHAVGARATAEVQQDPFQTAINGALLPPVVEPLNELIRRIVELNWDGVEGAPTLKVTLTDDASLSEISTYVQQLVLAEAMQVDPDLEDWLRERAGLPPANQQVRAQKLQAQQAEHEATVAQSQAKAQDPQGIEAATATAAAKVAAGAGAGPSGSQGTPQSAKPKPVSSPSAKPRRQPPAAAGKSTPKKTLDQPDGPVAAGLIVQAADTGRVLMIQRTDDHADDDDTRARWEFAGGKLEDDETPWQGGVREWQEETGATLPAAATRTGQFVSPDGKYQAFGVTVPREQDLTLGDHDTGEVADVQWWEPARLSTDHRVRGKVQQALPDVHRLLAGKQLDQASEDAKRRSTVAVDFDGVLHPNTPDDQPLTEAPIAGAVDGLRKLAERYRIVIFTARTNLAPVRAYLAEHDMGGYEVTNQKPIATAYIDDRAEPFTNWDAMERRMLDAPFPPPNLGVATDPARECGSCKMFDPVRGVCMGYNNLEVEPGWVCDSWEQGSGNPKPPADMAGVQLDGFAPMSGGVEGENGLQMVPETEGKAKPKRRKRKSAASDPEGERENDEPQGGANDDAKNVRQHARTLDADPAAEPTAPWFERLLSQDRLREAFDGARDHIEAACLPATLAAARQMAHQAANNAELNRLPPQELTDALTRHYEDMYHLGHQTVQLELAKQRAALGRQLDSPTDSEAAAGIAGSRLARARQRGEHSARNIANRISERLGRATITGLKDPQTLQTEAEQAATSALHVEALTNTAAMVNDGRYGAAMGDGQVVGAYYTAILDPRTCAECERADDGTLLSPDAAVALGPPNPLCAGQDYCRCVLVWTLSTDPAAMAAIE